MSLPSEVRLVEAEQLDYPRFADLQRTAFADVLAALDSDGSHFTADFYRWKYGGPLGPARVAEGTLGEAVVAGNSMTRFRVRTPLGMLSGWQSCDTATLPDARGQGFFSRCISALEQSLSDGELFFGFPNKNSLRGFEKLGWMVWRDVDTWVKPLSFTPGGLGYSQDVQQIERFDLRQERLNEAIASSGVSYLDRSAAYMNWRYLDHPLFRYQALAWPMNDEEWGAVAVVREARVAGRRYLMVMELWGLAPELERRMLLHCTALAARQGLPHLVVMDSSRETWSKWSSGFVRIPRRLLPKRQLLMGQRIGERRAPLQGLDWRTQFGDWDAF